MRCDTIQPQVDGGIDRHVAGMDRCGIEADGEGRVHQHLRTDPTALLQARQPCRGEVVGCVEGRCTWDWRADLCADEGLPVVLGHALSMRVSHGGNAKNDRLDSHTLAALLRGGRMPQTSVYPGRMRATRARWRRRHHLRHTRAEFSAPLQHTASQSHLSGPLGRLAKPQNRRGRIARGEHRGVQTNMAGDVALGDVDAPLLAAWARSIETTAHGHDPGAWALWRPMPGVGNLLALVRRYALEPIARCPRVQAGVSDGRVGKRAKASQGTRYGASGTPSGNAPLQWACSAAAGLVLKHHEPAPTDLATLATRHGQGKALALLAHQRGRAVEGLLKPHVAFDPEQFLAPEGWRERTRLASHGSHRGQRHATGAARRALMRVGHAPAHAVHGPRGRPGILAR